MIETIFTLLIAFQLKHFICDYPLQNSYMLGKMQEKDWVKPLLAHSMVHMLGTIFILSWINPILALILSLVDLVAHFTIDRLKASPNIGGRFNPTQPYFWWALGADQMAHHLTHYLFIFIALSYV